MSLPKEPRQLMINLMYLVLTALLAMNVSSEILNAFKTMNNSLIRSNKTAEDRSLGAMKLFEDYKNDPKVAADKKKRVEDAMKIADDVNNKTTAIIAELNKYKEMIVQASGGYEADGIELKQIENLDGGTRVMIDEGNGPKLLQSLKSYKDEIAGLVPKDETAIVSAGTGNNPDIFAQLPLDFSTQVSENNPSGDWSTGNFHMSPTIASVALINKYINDARACQTVAIDRIWALATGEKQNLLRLNAKPMTDYAIIVSADNSYLLPGEKYHARIAMGTYNKKLKNLSFNVNGRTLFPNEEGVVDFSEVSSSNGAKNINVSATFTDTILNADGTKSLKKVDVKLPKPAQYFVGEATASISLDKMNVFYIGVANPITLSASGIPSDKLQHSEENCKLNPLPGVHKYEVWVEKAGTAKINLFGTKADGTPVNFGTYNYRVKYLPDPVAYVANKRGGAVGVNEMKAQIGVIARLEGSDFDAKFNVVSFDMAYQPRRGDYREATSNTMYLNDPKANSEVKSMMSDLDIGGKLYFDNIRAVGPDKKVRNLGSMVFILKY